MSGVSSVIFLIVNILAFETMSKKHAPASYDIASPFLTPTLIQSLGTDSRRLSDDSLCTLYVYSLIQTMNIFIFFRIKRTTANLLFV